jgi:hypothetical protein
VDHGVDPCRDRGVTDDGVLELADDALDLWIVERDPVHDRDPMPVGA